MADNEPKKISQLPVLPEATGSETLPVFYQGTTYQIRLDSVKFFLNKTDLGLGNVDNTSDLDKPVSTATLSALNDKANQVHNHAISDVEGLTDVLLHKASDTHVHSVGQIDGLDAVLLAKANQVHSHTLQELPEVGQALTGKADLNHVHEIANVTGLDSRLTNIETTVANLSGGNVDIEQAIAVSPTLAEMLSLKASVEQLDAKAEINHIHHASEIDGLSGAITDVVLGRVSGTFSLLNGKADREHTHLAADITDFEEAVDHAADNRGYIKAVFNDW